MKRFMVSFPMANHSRSKIRKLKPKVPLIFATQIKICLRKKQGILAIKIRTLSYVSEPRWILIENFLANHDDIFLDELSGMPLEREVHHTIELMYGVTLIAKAPYRHSFEKNVELKTQLNVFLNKGYIRIRKSPWGVIVLFQKKKDNSLRLCVL